MRSPLTPLYNTCGWLAGLFMIALLGCILASIMGRQFDFYIRGIDSYAGYCMAASAFLALAHTFAQGDHIRVTLVIGRFTGRPRRWLELWCIALAIAISGAFAAFSVKMAWWSYRFHDISAANDATPLWIPQLGMAFGTLVFCLAFVEEFFLVARGSNTRPAQSELARTE